MAGRFSQSRNDGSYKPGTAPHIGQLLPAGMVAAASAFGSGSQPYGTPGAAILFDAFDRPLSWDAFRSPIDGGPGVPIQPRFPDPNRSPREFQFNPGWNLVVTPRTESQQTRFAELRALADACPYLRIAINHRKKQIRGLRWEVSPLDAKTPSAKKEFQGDLNRVNKFLERPNRIDGLRFGEWIGQAIEETLVTDALCFFKAPTMDGKELHSLVQIDGATIKLLIDEFGHIAGYQQILYGYPTTQYRTDPVDDVVRTAEELDGRILYLVSNPSVDNVYGTAPVEEIRPIIDLAIRRIARQLEWYTSGTVPDSFLISPVDLSDPETIRSNQASFDSFTNLDERSKSRWLPFGTSYIPTKPYQYTKDEEEAIISSICAHMGVSRSLFVAQVNKATAENDRNISEDVGLKPLMQFIRDWINDVIQNDLGMKDIGFNWVQSTAGSEYENAQALSLYVTSGIMTVDEVRAEKGMDPLPEEERPEAKVAAMRDAMGAPKPGEEPPDEKNPAPKSPFPPKPGAKKPADDAAQKAELVAWEKFSKKRIGKSARPFDATSLPSRVVDAVVRGLKTANTDTDVHGVFAEARALLVKGDKKSYEHDFKHKTQRMFARERAAVMAHAALKLPKRTAEEAAA